LANLIITIIGIVIVVIAAVAGAYYGGQAFEQGQINSIANSIVSESQQILQAERLWSVNNNQPDISGMNSPTTSNGVTYFAIGNASGAGISALIDSKILAEWPPMGGPLAPPAPASGLIGDSANDYGCYNFSGYQGRIGRMIFAYHNSNYVRGWPR
jgi:hypothetical protein